MSSLPCPADPPAPFAWRQYRPATCTCGICATDGQDAVVRLADIPPTDGEQVPGGWWPPAMLDADWIAANATFDVFHVHFGFDAKTPEELRAVADALRRAGVPLVVTVHDLRNPHHPSPELHDAQLGMLIEHAAAVITLTPGAAREIAARWGREATVLAHPHVVDWDTMARPRPVHRGFVVGLHAKSLRANMDGPAVADVLADAVAGLPGARLQINLHHEVFEPGKHFRDPVGGRAGCGSSRASRWRCASTSTSATTSCGRTCRARRIGAAVPVRHAFRAGWRRAWTSAPR